jgi:hypothetical protein
MQSKMLPIESGSFDQPTFEPNYLVALCISPQKPRAIDLSKNKIHQDLDDLGLQMELRSENVDCVRGVGFV